MAKNTKKIKAEKVSDDKFFNPNNIVFYDGSKDLDTSSKKGDYTIIPILCTTNNYGIPQYETCLSSICEHLAEGYKIKVYCIYEKGSKDIGNIERIKEIYPNRVSEVKLICFEDNCEMVEWKHKKKQWPDVIYYSLYAEFLIPEDKFIFLDDDTLCFNSIHRLYNIDLGDNAWAGTVQLNAGTATSYLEGVISRYYPTVKYCCGNYLNKGVSVINNKLWREEHAFEKLKAILTNENLGFPEQDAMNVVFYGRTINLHPKYAFFNSSFYTTVYLDKDKAPTFRALGRYYCELMKDCLLDFKNTVVMVHYAGTSCKYFKTDNNTALREEGVSAMKNYWKLLREHGFETPQEKVFDDARAQYIEGLKEKAKKEEEEKLKKDAEEAQKRVETNNNKLKVNTSRKKSVGRIKTVLQ